MELREKLDGKRSWWDDGWIRLKLKKSVHLMQLHLGITSCTIRENVTDGGSSMLTGELRFGLFTCDTG